MKNFPPNLKLMKLVLSFWIITAMSLVTHAQEGSSRAYPDGFDPDFIPAISSVSRDHLLSAGIMATPYSEDFESGAPGWTTEGFFHLVANPQLIEVLNPDINPRLVHLPDDGSLPPAFSGNHIMWYGEDATGTFIGPYNPEQAELSGGTSLNSNTGSLISPQYSLSGVTAAKLVFYTWWEIEGVDADAYDLMCVDISTDGAQTFVELGKLNPLNDVNGEPYVAFTNSGLGLPAGWVANQFDLSAFVGYNIIIRFRFSTVDNLYNGFRGWLIDDVQIITDETNPPEIVSIVPNSGVVESMFEINGNSFDYFNGTDVFFGETQISASVLSSEKIQCQVPNLALGTYDVTVVNPDGLFDTYINGFTITSVSPPVITSITPNEETVGSSIPVTILGTNFESLSTVFIGTLELLETIVVSSTEITGNTSPDLAVGTHNVRVNNPDTQYDLLVDGFTVLPGTNPNITVTPTFLDENLEPDETSTQTLNVGNVGDGDLNFNIQLQEIDLADEVVEFDVDSYPHTGQAIEVANSNGSIEYLPEFSKQIYKSSAAAAFENILVFEGSGTLEIYHYNTALENLGLPRTVVFSIADFETELYGGTIWDLVIVNSYLEAITPTFYDGVNSYLESGGYLIFSDWAVEAYFDHPLLGSLGISFVSGFTIPDNFSATAPSSPVFQTPNTISDFYWTDDQYIIDGQIVNDIGGATGLAAFEGYPTSDAIVLNSSGTSFFNAFQAVNFNGDDDSDGKLDIVELIENQIYYLMADSPFWLTCSPVSGTVPAGGSSVIDANFDATGLADGEYHANINIGSNDPDEPMVTVPVTLTVGGGCEPGWTIVNYTNSTTAYGIVTIDDIGTPASTGDLVGAFVDEECRGIGEVVINGGIAYVTLLIQGEVIERAEFRIWDASECTIIPEAYCADTDPGGILGYPPDYLPIGSGEGCVVEQTLTHNTGWNLISLFVHPDDMSPASIFADFSCLLQVKDMTQSYDPALPPFLNTLAELTDGMGYFTNSSCLEEHIIVGQLVDGPATPIDLSAGWNLIGYPFDTPTAPEVAFASLISAGNLVQVKSMTQSYDPALPPFLNTLTTLEPGKGYFINVNSNVTFNYPAPAGAALKSAEAGTIQSPWSTMKYTQSMVQYGNVTLDGFPIDGEAVVGAFVNNECRGQGAVKEAGGETFTTLVINGEKVENVAFKLFQNGNTYSSNTMTVNNPGGITQAVTDIQFYSSLLDEIDLRVYPNPAKDYLTIAYELNMHSKVNITILDMLGKVVYTYQEMNEAGSHRMTLENVKTMYNMNEGTYILKFSNIEYTTSQKIMIQ